MAGTLKGIKSLVSRIGYRMLAKFFKTKEERNEPYIETNELRNILRVLAMCADKGWRISPGRKKRREKSEIPDSPVSSPATSSAPPTPPASSSTAPAHARASAPLSVASAVPTTPPATAPTTSSPATAAPFSGPIPTPSTRATAPAVPNSGAASSAPTAPSSIAQARRTPILWREQAGALWASQSQTDSQNAEEESESDGLWSSSRPESAPWNPNTDKLWGESISSISNAEHSRSGIFSSVGHSVNTPLVSQSVPQNPDDANESEHFRDFSLGLHDLPRNIFPGTGPDFEFLVE